MGLTEIFGNHEVVGGWNGVVLVGLWGILLHGLTGDWSDLLANLVSLSAVLRSGLEAISEILHEAKVHQVELLTFSFQAKS